MHMLGVFPVVGLGLVVVPTCVFGSSVPAHVRDADDLVVQPSLNFSSPAPYIFSSLHGLFQQWPNTFFPNGHTIAPCEIPRHTLFYHGRHDSNSPPSPEWLAFDIEMSYGIMGSMKDSRMLTYRTTKPVKCLYFDGMSASLMGSGTESQMAFLYGDSDSIPDPWPHPPGGPVNKTVDPPSDAIPPPDHGPPEDEPPGHKPPNFGHWNPLKDEYFRARGLCNWIKDMDLGGPGWGYEAIVRMNAGFELIWCDFESDSLKLMSNLNVSAPLMGRKPSSDVSHGASFPVDMEGLAKPVHGQIPLVDIQPDDSDEGPHGPGMTDPREPFRGIATWMWFSSATRHYGSTGSRSIGTGRGESRAKPKTCGLFTFYDPKLQGQSSARINAEAVALNISRGGQWKGPKDEYERQVALDKLIKRRRVHRTNHVSEQDGEYMRTLVEKGLRALLNSEQMECSGTDWHLVSQEIVSFYDTGLRNLLDLLSQPNTITELNWLSLRNLLQSIREMTHWFMMPFFEYPHGPWTEKSLRESFSISSPAAQAALERCQGQYEISDYSPIHETEALLVSAISETLTGICYSIFDIGLDVEYEWLSNFNIVPEDHSEEESYFVPPMVLGRIRSWKQELEELMAWLGWVDQWTGCDAPCAPNELCYIPMWPVAGWPKRRRPDLNTAGAPENRGLPSWWDFDAYLWKPICVNSSAYPP